MRYSSPIVIEKIYQPNKIILGRRRFKIRLHKKRKHWDWAYAMHRNRHRYMYVEKYIQLKTERKFMAMMALSSSTSTLPFFNFSANENSSGRRNALSMAVRASLSDDSALLLQAAKYTVDSFVEDGMVIGLGSGRASRYAIQYLGRQLRSGAVKDITGIPSSVDSASEAAKAGVPLDQYTDSSKIDLAFDDADVIEEESLSAVIGRQKMQGGESIIQEKTILRTAGKLVLIVTAKQYQGGVEGSVPVLIKSINWLETAEEIDDLFLGDAEVWRRPSIDTGYADPLGGDFPLVTKEGHNVLDVIFTSPIPNLAEVADSLDQVVGVVEHGVISRMPCTAVIATEDGVRIVDNARETEASIVSL